MPAGTPCFEITATGIRLDRLRKALRGSVVLAGPQMRQRSGMCGAESGAPDSKLYPGDLGIGISRGCVV